MQIKKIFKFTSEVEKLIKSKPSTISSVLPNSTLFGRKKIEELKRIGQNKRQNTKTI